MIELTDLFKNRYSCRNYLPDDIKDEDIQKILYDGTLAPSTKSIIQSIGACIENMLLSATDLGISSLWIRATSCIEKEIEIMLDKQNEHLMACISLGYDNKKERIKVRNRVEEITSWHK